MVRAVFLAGLVLASVGVADATPVWRHYPPGRDAVRVVKVAHHRGGPVWRHYRAPAPSAPRFVWIYPPAKPASPPAGQMVAAAAPATAAPALPVVTPAVSVTATAPAVVKTPEVLSAAPLAPAADADQRRSAQIFWALVAIGGIVAGIFLATRRRSGAQRA